MTLEPCRFFVIPRATWRDCSTAIRRFARHLIRMLIGKVRSLTQKVLDLALKDVYGRFAKFHRRRTRSSKGHAPWCPSVSPSTIRRAHRRLARDG